MGFNLDDYEPVATRLARWLEANPDGQVMTEMLSEPGADICVFKTTLLIGGVPIATGHAEEVRGQGNVNRTSHVENCETSSTGRALGNAGYAGSDPMKRPSREEMAKVVRQGGAPAQASGTKTIVNKMQGKCVDCGQVVIVGGGLAVNDGSGWKTKHNPGECPTEDPF